jgi:hypothetical protein
MLSEDGLLQFTDNEKLMPKEYIAGLLTVVVTVVTTIVSIIVSIFQPVVGAVMAAAGTVFYGIMQSFAMDYNGTFCQAEVNTTQQIMDNFPVGLFQSEVSFDVLGMSEEDVEELSEIFLGANYINVPGGILLIGAVPDERVFRFEFHPGIHHTRFDLLFEAKSIDYKILLANQNDGLQGFLMKGRHYPVHSIHILDTLNYLEIDSLIIDGEGYYKGVSDTYLNISYSANIAAFLLFVHLAALHGNHINNYIIPVDGYFGSVPRGPWRDGVYLDADFEFGDNIYAVFYSPLADEIVRLKGHDYESYYRDFVKFTGWDKAVQFAINSAFVSDDESPNISVPRSFGFSFMRISSEDWAECTVKVYDNYFMEHPERIDCPISSFHILAEDIGAIVSHKMWAGGVTDVTSSMLWAVKMPKWNRRTFISWILLAGLVTTVAVATAAIVTIKVRNSLRMARAESTRKVETAWRKYTSAENPAEAKAAYKDYRKTVRLANLKAKFIGGTRYNYTGYWNGDPIDSQEGSGGETSDKASGLFRLLGQVGEPNTSELLLANALHTSTILSYIDRLDLSTPNEEVMERAETSLNTYLKSINIK